MDFSAKLLKKISKCKLIIHLTTIVKLFDFLILNTKLNFIPTIFKGKIIQSRDPQSSLFHLMRWNKISLGKFLFFSSSISGRSAMAHKDYTFPPLCRFG